MASKNDPAYVAGAPPSPGCHTIPAGPPPKCRAKGKCGQPGEPQTPLFSINREGDNCYESWSCPKPDFRSNPPTGLDRATAAANLGNALAQAVIRGLDQISAGSSCQAAFNVNLVNLNLLGRVSLPDGGPFQPVTDLTYNAIAAEPIQTEYGYGWNGLLRQSVSYVNDSAADIIKGSRLRLQYDSRNPSSLTVTGTYSAQSGYALNKLVQNIDGTYVETQPDGFELHYAAPGSPAQISNLQWMQDRAGNRWTLTYSGSKIAKVQDPLGGFTTFAYDGNNYISRITDPSGRNTDFVVGTLTNDSIYYLKQVTSPESCITAFDYDTSLKQLKSWTTPTGVITTFAYAMMLSSSLNRLNMVRWPSGGITTYALGSINSTKGYLKITDPLNQITTITASVEGANADNLLSEVQDPLGFRTTMTYVNQQLTKFMDPRGYITTFTLTTLTNSGVAAISEVQLPLGGRYTYTYDSSDRLWWVAEPNGARTTLVWNGTTGFRDALEDPFGFRITYTYNTAGQIKEVQNALGFRTTTVYDALGNSQATVDALGRRTSYTYNTNNQRVAVMDPLGFLTTTTLDDLNRPIAVIDPLGNRTSTTYYADGQVRDVTDPLGRISSLQYDGAGRLQTTIDALGQRTTFAYNVANLVTSITNALGNITTNVFDPLQRLSATIDPLGNTTTLGYDSAGNQNATTDPLGNITTTQFDGENRPSAVIDPLGNRSSSTYDLSGNLRTMVDPLSFVTTHTYNLKQQLIEQQDALGFRTTFAYDAVGRQTGLQNARGNLTTTVYDGVGQAVAVIDALNQIATTVYDAAGRPQGAMDQLGNITTTVYDAAGRNLALVDPLNNRTTFGYDAASEQTGVTDPFGKLWQTVYDALGRVKATADPLGNTTTTVYDALGQAREVQDANNHRTTTVYDKAQRMVAVINALNNITTTVYDAASRQVALWDARGYRTTFGYDAAGRQTLMVDAVGNRFTSTFDAAGQQVTYRDGRGVLITYSYDAVGRQTLRNRSDGVRVTSTYDGNGNRTQMQDATGTTGYSFDTLDRLRELTNPAGLAITYSYDSRSLRSAMIDPWGGRFTYAFDAAGQITSLTNPDSRTTLFYQDHTRRSGLRHGNNTRVSYTYDDANRMIGVNNMNSAGTAFNRFTYTFDGVGNRTNVLELDGSRLTYTYDAADQLTRERGTGFSGFYSISHVYDSAGNRTDWTDFLQLAQATLSYDPANQVKLESGSVPYTYDAAGNLTAVDWGAPNIYTLTWDAENRLTSYNDPFGYGLETYTYDGDGRRMRRVPAFAAEQQYFWDQENLLLIGTDSWSPIYRFTYEPALYGNLLSEALWFIGVQQRFYHFDGLGSTVRLSLTGGTVAAATMHYEAYGMPLEAGDAFSPFRWLGQSGYQLQIQLGDGYQSNTYDYANYYVRNRYYDRWTARWTSRDRRRDDDLGNQYRYVSNIPTIAIDPSGYGWINRDEFDHIDWDCFRQCLRTCVSPPGNQVPPTPAGLCVSACNVCRLAPIPENPACITCALCATYGAGAVAYCLYKCTVNRTVRLWQCEIHCSSCTPHITYEHECRCKKCDDGHPRTFTVGGLPGRQGLLQLSQRCKQGFVVYGEIVSDPSQCRTKQRF